MSLPGPYLAATALCNLARAALLLALVICGSATASGQARWTGFATPVFRNIGPDQGLPNPAVTALAEDGEGFLWAGTQGGLARWDGYHFRVYRPEPGVAGSLPDGWITALHADPGGNLWIGTTSAGLARYDRDSDSFVSYGAGRFGLSDVSVAAIADDGAGGLWIGTTAGGLDHLDPATGHVETLRHEVSDKGSLPSDDVEALLEDRDGTLWAGTRSGLARRPRGSGRFIAVPPAGGSKAPVAILSLFQAPDGRIWIGTEHGAFVASEAGADMQPVPTPGQDLSNQWVYAIGTDGGGDIWLGTYGQGIVAIDGATGFVRRIKHEATLPQSLSDDTIASIYRDRAGGIWVGSTGGLSRLESANGAILTVFGGTGDPRGLSDTNVLSVLSASNGLVWLGLGANGIDILDPVLGRVKTLAVTPSVSGTGVPNQRILSLAEGPGGAVFIGTYHGLYRADATGSRIAQVLIPGRDPAGLGTALAFTGGRLWIGGRRDGIWSIVPGGPAKAVKHFDSSRLTDRRITCLLPDPGGALWIGTRHGLNRLDLASGNIAQMLPDPADAGALAAGYVSSLLLDKTGRLWVGTFGGGIDVLTTHAGSRPDFRRLGVQQGLPDSNIDAMLQDSQGRIWVTTDNGIAFIDPDSFAVTALQPADGVAMSAYWAHSAAATPQGALLFGGTGGGLTVIRPERYRRWDDRPPIVIDDIRVGGAMQPGARFNGAGKDVRLLVPADANSMTVEFSALDFSAPENNRYAYRLDGFDRDWIETDATQRVAAYTNLAPGAYTLQLRGTNRNGGWSDVTLRLSIRVRPAWYQTWAFRLGLAVAALTAVLALVQRRTRYLRRRQRALETLVAERTAELEAKRREIEMMAYHDVLTGLPNRRMFNQQIDRLLSAATRYGRHFALLLIDLDGFKEINDTLGHDAGDAFLVQAAARLMAMIRSSDSVARLGGDEFAILVGDLEGALPADDGAVNAVCQRVAESFVDAVGFKGAAMRVTASFGVAFCPKDGVTQEALYRAADKALYEAKRCGKNTWRLYEAVMDRGH